MPLEFKNFKNYSELVYGFSERADGSMKWFADPDTYRPNEENRQRFFGKLGVSLNQIVTADLVHGTRVVLAGATEASTAIPQTDGLISREANVFLTITAADCFPLYFYNPSSGAIGLAHAGWRSIMSGMVGEMVRALGGDDHLFFGLGPGIRVCHFEISSEDSKKFSEYPEAIQEREGKTFVDLPLIIKQQLEVAGLQTEHIEDSNLCTHCLVDRYFSFRRDKPKQVEAMIAYIGKK